MIYTDIGTAHLENKNRIRKEVMKQGHKAANDTKYQIKQEAKWEAQPIESNIVEHNPTLLYSGL